MPKNIERKMAETWSCALSSNFSFSVALFHNLTNAIELRKRVMSGEIKVALLKPSLIVEQFQLQAAATKAVHQSQLNKMQTKTLHSEVLFCLSPTKNISDAFRKFGLEDKDQSVVVVEVHKPGESKLSDVQELIQGDLIPLDRLPEFTDVKLVKKVYKLKEEELLIGSLVEAVVGRMAAKEFVSFS